MPKYTKYDNIAGAFIFNLPPQARSIGIIELQVEMYLFLNENSLQITEENYRANIKKVHQKLRLAQLKANPELYKKSLDRASKFKKEHPEKTAEYQRKWNAKNKERKYAREQERKKEKKEEMEKLHAMPEYMQHLKNLHNKIINR